MIYVIVAIVVLVLYFAAAVAVGKFLSEGVHIPIDDSSKTKDRKSQA